MYPTRKDAMEMLEEAALLNPGPWKKHSYLVADCAERIARECGLDTEKAYCLGLLHDIGRRFGVTQLRHVYDGYFYMNQIGYNEVARVCLTHSFHIKNLDN